MKPIFFIMVIFMLSSCDSAKVRDQGTCLSSSTYGGPYEVLASGLNIKVRNRSTGEERLYPNDQTWNDVECR